MTNTPDTRVKVHRLTINDRAYDALVLESDTLLNVLRERLDLIGTKQGCDKGDCGACTVLVDDEPILSCLSIACNFDQSERITTIEGLMKKDGPDLLLLAFEKSGALQCGFCQPGMILSARALLLKNQRPSLDDIKHALSGNLCRCTGYTKIYLAVLSAALVLNNQASDLDEALSLVRESRFHLGDA